MRTFSVIMPFIMAACVSSAAPQFNQLDSVVLGTNTGGSATIDLSGYIDTIYVSNSDGTSTGNVIVSYAPAVGTTAIGVSTNAVIGEKVWRPVVDRTDTAGAALTSDDPERYIIAGETITFAVTGSATGITWKCLIVTDDGK